MAGFTAFLDACVLYRAPVRDLLVQLAQTGLFCAKWSDAVHEEWIKALLDNRSDLNRPALERTRQLMEEAVQDAKVTGYERLTHAINLPDDNDRHVLAAAIVGRADVIVTYNSRDFPSEVLANYNLEVQHPDEFVEHVFDLSSAAVIDSVSVVRQRLCNPPMSVDDYLTVLERHELVQTVSHLREHAKRL